jgi:nicotinamidase-related amidase
MYKTDVSRRTFLTWTGVAASALAAHSVIAGDNTAVGATKDSASLLVTPSGITPEGYVYQQPFMPVRKQHLDLRHTALFITDPQNDFLSPGGGGWPLVGEEVVASKVVEHEKLLVKTAKDVGIRVFYSPHMYSEKDYKYWDRSKFNAIDQLMFANNMFKQGTWGHQFHPELEPDDNTIVMNPHKGLSNFWTGDASIQLREHNIETLIMCGMACNLCVESHARDAVENGFKVILVADCTAGSGPLAKKAALVNYEYIANELVTTAQIITRLNETKKAHS